jgi:hypothetical protein
VSRQNEIYQNEDGRDDSHGENRNAGADPENIRGQCHC